MSHPPPFSRLVGGWMCGVHQRKGPSLNDLSIQWGDPVVLWCVGGGGLCWHSSDTHVTNQYKGVQSSQRLWEIFDQRVGSVLFTTTTIKTPYLEIRDLQHWSCSGSTKWPNTFLKHFMLVFPLIRQPSVFPPVKPTVPAPHCLSSFHKPRWTTREDKGKSRASQRWLTDFLLPEDTSTAKRWFLLDDEPLWIHKQWSQLYALLTRVGGKTSEAVSGSMAIKPTQGLCFLVLLAHRSNTGFYSTSDQTYEIFLKYYYNGKDAFETEQRNYSNTYIVLVIYIDIYSTTEINKTNAAYKLD